MKRVEEMLKTVFALLTAVSFAAFAGHESLWFLPRTVEVTCLIIAGLGYSYFLAWPAFRRFESSPPANPNVVCMTCGQTVPKGPKTNVDEEDGLNAPIGHT